MSQKKKKNILTLQISVSPKMLAFSYFLNRIKYISQNSNFRRDIILRNGLLVDWGGGTTTSRGRGGGGGLESQETS